MLAELRAKLARMDSMERVQLGMRALSFKFYHILKEAHFITCNRAIALPRALKIIGTRVLRASDLQELLSLLGHHSLIRLLLYHLIVNLAI